MTADPDGIRLRVYGTPAPQGSKRAFAVRGKGGTPTGKIAVIESSHDRVKDWRGAIVSAAEEAGLARLNLDGPLMVSMIFWLARPKAHYGTGRNRNLLRPAAPALPLDPPDLSKLARAVEDALTDCRVWCDDALVTSYGRLNKRFADNGTPPGVLIYVRADLTGL